MQGFDNLFLFLFIFCLILHVFNFVILILFYAPVFNILTRDLLCKLGHHNTISRINWFIYMDIYGDEQREAVCWEAYI